MQSAGGSHTEVALGGYYDTRHEEGFIITYFATTPSAANIEPIDGDGIVFLFCCFLARVELAALVDILSA
jgi:hypothetical protein